jgi:replicative DNA helicase
MAKSAQTNKLGFLGEDFQYKLVHEFIEDKEFFKDLCDIIDQNMFTDPNLKTVVGVMRDYYKKEQTPPNYDVLKIALANKAHNETEKEYYIAIVDKIHSLSSEGAGYIRELAEKFFKQQNMIRVAHEIIKIAGNGDIENYDRCVEMLNKALTQGISEDLGSCVFDNENETLSEDYRVAIPTGIGKIDETLEGGLGKGELGVIVGSSSFGKTSLTTAIASYAATYRSPQNNNDGYKVLQIVFEDRVKQIQRKHFGRITGVEAKDLSKPGIVEMVKEQLEKYEDREMLQKNLRIVRLPSGEKTADDIKRLIMKLRNIGFSPDLVIVDYFECLLCRGDSSDDKWEKEGKTMRKFEAMAGELNIGIWIPVQGTKDSLNVEVVTMDKAGGSFKKIQIAHIVMSIARTVEDIQESKATIAILKNRAGKAGKVFNGVEFNNGTCRISTDNVDEFDSQFAFNKQKDKEQKELQRNIFEVIKQEKKF